MNSNILKAIEVLVAQISNKTESPDSLRITQAALNLAHTAQVLEQVKQ